MKVEAGLIYLTLLLAEVIAGNNGNCNFNGITEDDWENGYIYNKVWGFTKMILTIGSNTAVEFVSARSDYLITWVNTSTSTVHIETNDNFVNFDEGTPTTVEDLALISADFSYRCPDGVSVLNFLLIVQDENNHDPEFNSKSYQFKLPQKTYEVGEDISKYGPQIIVTDVDFSNQDIIFSLFPEGIVTIETEVLGNKSYRAVLKANDMSLIDLTRRYDIAAFDYSWRVSEPIRPGMSIIDFVFTSGRGIKFKLNTILFFVLTISWLYNVQ